MGVQQIADDEMQRAPTDGEGTDTDVRSVSKDDAFHLLQNARRRAVLRFMAEHAEEDRFQMRDLAEEVAAWEHDTTVRQLTSDERQRVYIALYQSHLPKLDEHGIIAYNQSRGVVETTELTPVLDPYLEDGLHAETELTVGVQERESERPRLGLTEAVSILLSR
jgi:hypothetical protein